MASRSSIRLVVVAVAASVAVSVPLVLAAADRFVDVPDSNVFHDDISWLADAGVTRGCNPPANTNFCPGDDVTREQMAAFMRRLAEGRVVDAGTVEGSSAADLKTTVTGFIGSETVFVPTLFEARLGEVELSAADGGFAVVTTQALGTQSTSGASWTTWVQAGDSECDNGKPAVPGSEVTAPSNPGDLYNLPVHASFVMEVTDDTTLTLCAWANAASNINAEEVTISVIQTHHGSLTG